MTVTFPTITTPHHLTHIVRTNAHKQRYYRQTQAFKQKPLEGLNPDKIWGPYL